MPEADDTHRFDAAHAFGGLHDPLEARRGGAEGGHPGVVALLAASDLLAAGEPARAVEACDEARRRGVPAELVPYLAVVAGTSLVLAGRAERAVEVLADAWSGHPDVAALPALLGAAQLAAGDATSAAHSMYAALVSDDPDRSLALHRRRLTQLLAITRAG